MGCEVVIDVTGFTAAGGFDGMPDALVVDVEVGDETAVSFYIPQKPLCQPKNGLMPSYKRLCWPEARYYRKDRQFSNHLRNKVLYIESASSSVG